jgi:hypothetical protein
VIRCLHEHCCWSKRWHVWIDKRKLIPYVETRTEFIICIRTRTLHWSYHGHHLFYVHNNISTWIQIHCRLITYCKLIVWYVGIVLDWFNCLNMMSCVFRFICLLLCFAHVHYCASHVFMIVVLLATVHSYLLLSWSIVTILTILSY